MMQVTSPLSLLPKGGWFWKYVQQRSPSSSLCASLLPAGRAMSLLSTNTRCNMSVRGSHAKDLEIRAACAGYKGSTLPCSLLPRSYLHYSTYPNTCTKGFRESVRCPSRLSVSPKNLDSALNPSWLLYHAADYYILDQSRLLESYLYSRAAITGCKSCAGVRASLNQKCNKIKVTTLRSYVLERPDRLNYYLSRCFSPPPSSPHQQLHPFKNSGSPTPMSALSSSPKHQHLVCAVFSSKIHCLQTMSLPLFHFRFSTSRTS
jgi:hypothetical protein